MTSDERVAAIEPICVHCGRVIHKDGDWWVDEDDNLTCWDQDNEDNLGPHVPTGEEADRG